MSGPARALARELGLLATDRPEACVVTGRDPGIAGAVLEEAPARRVLAPGPATRVAVAAGCAVAGRPTVAVLDAVAGVPEGPWSLGGALVAVTDALAVALAIYRAGVPVVQPSWGEDVGPLLHAMLARGGPYGLYVHDGEIPARPSGLDAPTLGRPRILTEGAHALVVASGRLTVPLARAAVGLARRGVTLTAVEVPLLAGGPFDPRAATDGVLVSARASVEATPRLVEREDLRWVPVVEPEARALAEAVLRAVPARRQ